MQTKMSLAVIGLMVLSSQVQARTCNQSVIRGMSYFMNEYNANVAKCVRGPTGPACETICSAVDSIPEEFFGGQNQSQNQQQLKCPELPPISQPPQQVRCPELPQAPVCPPSSVVERCSQGEADRIYRSAQEDTIRRLKKDLLVEGRVTARGFAENPDLCIKNAHRKASQDIRQAEVDCERQLTSGLSTRCDEAGVRIVQNPIKVLPYRGEGKYKEERRGKTPEVCKRDAQSKAARNAIEACQQETGVACQLQREPTQATFREKEERRYGLVGPKDTYYICESDALAMPINVGFTCAVEVYTRIEL